jgi:hypothetical protein
MRTFKLEDTDASQATCLTKDTEFVVKSFVSSGIQLGATTLLAYLIGNKISPKHPVMVALLGGILGAITLFKIEDIVSHSYFKSVKNEECKRYISERLKKQAYEQYKDATTLSASQLA